MQPAPLKGIDGPEDAVGDFVHSVVGSGEHRTPGSRKGDDGAAPIIGGPAARDESALLKRVDHRDDDLRRLPGECGELVLRGGLVRAEDREHQVVAPVDPERREYALSARENLEAESVHGEREALPDALGPDAMFGGE